MLELTGIGSLPHAEDETALRYSSAFDVPFEPERVSMLQRVQAPRFERLDALLAARTPAKTQWCGPATLVAYAGLDATKAVSLVREAVRESFARSPLLTVFLDEPGLGVHAPLGLESLAAEFGAERLGVHCCADIDWAPLLRAPIGWLSFDVRLSLDRVVSSEGWPEFIARGGRVALGLIPTTALPAYSVDELCESVEAALRATTRDWKAVLRSAWLTPACGLGLQSPDRCDVVLSELRRAQALLRALV